MKQASKVSASVFGAMLFGVAVSGFSGCKKDEPPPPLPTAAVTAAPTPSAPLELAPEEPVASAAPTESVKKPTGGAPAQSFSNCCKALLQNAQSAPEPNKTYMVTAGNMCTSMVAAGQGGPSIATALQGVLRGVGMPSACR
ncbi:MAG TPA: hypothetical protein VGI10_29050 [Polyangiaceae bacterium]|jgi:hypothetical protein